MKKIIVTIASLLLICASAFAKGDSYIYDYWGQPEKSPDTYRVSSVLYADNLGLDIPLKNPQGLFAFEDKLYLLDSDNNRIVELKYNENKTLTLVRIITEFNAPEGIVNTFASPRDLYINKDGSWFIADTNNARVVKLDKDLNYIVSFTEPDDPNYEKGKTFLPEKVVADTKGRVYILAKNLNQGFLKYEYDGTFTGYFGASEVVVDWSLVIRKKLATRAQREQMESFVPTEYSNVYIDNEGFLFAVMRTFDENDVSRAKPIRRLNALGKDILIKNGEFDPIGDVIWANAGGAKGPARFSDITVLDNDVYIAMDETRGRLFGYNSQGQMLFAFGGKGSIDGYFRNPTAIEHFGYDIFVLDGLNASITVFTPTDFGAMIYKATEHYACGEYDEAAAVWEDVLKVNGNYDLAYVGLGKAYTQQKRYKEAMDYLRLKRSRRLYSKAFKYYRKAIIEKYVGLFGGIAAAIIIIVLITKRINKIRKELMYEE